jgi:hypothetical protein
MHSLLGLAGLLGLVALAFGKPAAAILARVILIAPLVLILFVIEEKLTHGLILFRVLGL